MSIIEGLLETFTDLTESAAKILEDKNSAYRGGANILDSHANFKRIQKHYPELEVDEIMNIMMDKHLDVIRQGSYGSKEELKERICDCINYLVLIYDYVEGTKYYNEGVKEVFTPYQPKVSCEPCSGDHTDPKKPTDLFADTIGVINHNNFTKMQTMKIDGVKYESILGANEWTRVKEDK